MKYLDVDWGPDLPYCETMGHLTEAMLADGIMPYEFPEDKSSIYFDGTQDGEKGKDLGYIHIRAGSTPAVLLAWKENQLEQYWKYLKEQPRNECLRQMFWFDYMKGKITEGIWKLSDMGMDFSLMLNDMEVQVEDWENYYNKCVNYYGLP